MRDAAPHAGTTLAPALLQLPATAPSPSDGVPGGPAVLQSQHQQQHRPLSSRCPPAAAVVAGPRRDLWTEGERLSTDPASAAACLCLL